MVRSSSETYSVSEESAAVLLHVIEQLRYPLLSLRYQSETAIDAVEMKHLLTQALNLIDNASLALRLNQMQQVLPLEPVAVNAVIDDVVRIVKQSNKRLSDVDISHVGRRVIMTNRQALTAALSSVAISMADSPEVRRMRILTRTSGNQAHVGLFVDGSTKISAETVAVRKIQARQPISGAIGVESAGILIAQHICGALGVNLRNARQGGVNGISVTSILSSQLALV